MGWKVNVYEGVNGRERTGEKGKVKLEKRKKLCFI